MKALIKLGYIIILLVGISGASYLAVNVIGAFQSGSETFKINFELITEDTTGTGVIYTPQCFTTCHLPINFSYSGSAVPQSKILGVSDFTYTLSKLVQDDDVNVVGINLLVNKTFTKDVWTSNITCTSVFNATINATNENCVDNPFKYSQQLWKWDWEPITSNVNLTKDKWYIVDFVGKRTPKLETFATDIIPSINSVSMSELAWWNSSCNFRYPIISNATSRIPISVNDSKGINGYIMWTQNASAGDTIYAYFQNSGYTDFCGIANQTAEQNWENETVRIPPVGRGNITQALWGNVSANMLVFHFDNNADRTSYDSSPNVLNGIISGTWSNATGIYGQAINLTGNNPNVNLSTDVWNIGDASSGAVSFWTNLNSITAGHNYQLDFESALTITICCPNGIYYWLGNGPQGEVFVNITATKNTWYFITYTWDGTAGFAYLNGEYQGKQTTKGSPNWDWASQPSRIGSNQAGTSNMVGALDEFLFFNKNLSATEISQMYQNGNGRLGGNANNLTALGAEETPSTSESDGRSAIEQGIKDSLGVNAVIYTDQQVYTRNITGGQQLAKFDKFTLNGTKRWTFNYVTTGESFTNMMNITPSLYILEMQSLSTSDIRVKVSDFINQTK